jgi:hypothetical protein
LPFRRGASATAPSKPKTASPASAPPGGCETRETDYDVGGARIHDIRNAIERFYADEQFVLR